MKLTEREEKSSRDNHLELRFRKVHFILVCTDLSSLTIFASGVDLQSDIYNSFSIGKTDLDFDVRNRLEWSFVYLDHLKSPKSECDTKRTY